MQGVQSIGRMTDIMVIVLYLGCGLYCVVSCLMGGGKKRLFANRLICPPGRDSASCAEPEAFAAHMRPRALALGVGLLLFGGLLALDTALGAGQAWVTVLLTLLPLLLLAWYMTEQKKAVRRYWR